MTQNDEKRIEELISQHLQERETSWTAMDELDWLHHNRMKAVSYTHLTLPTKA